MSSNFSNILEWWDFLKKKIKKFFLGKGIVNAKIFKENRSEKEKEIQQLVQSLTADQLVLNETYNHLKSELLEYEKMMVLNHKRNLKIASYEMEYEVPDMIFFY